MSINNLFVPTSDQLGGKRKSRKKGGRSRSRGRSRGRSRSRGRNTIDYALSREDELSIFNVGYERPRRRPGNDPHYSYMAPRMAPPIASPVVMSPVLSPWNPFQSFQSSITQAVQAGMPPQPPQGLVSHGHAQNPTGGPPSGAQTAGIAHTHVGAAGTAVSGSIPGLPPHTHTALNPPVPNMAQGGLQMTGGGKKSIGIYDLSGGAKKKKRRSSSNKKKKRKSTKKRGSRKKKKSTKKRGSRKKSRGSRKKSRGRSYSRSRSRYSIDLDDMDDYDYRYRYRNVYTFPTSITTSSSSFTPPPAPPRVPRLQTAPPGGTGARFGMHNTVNEVALQNRDITDRISTGFGGNVGAALAHSGFAPGAKGAPVQGPARPDGSFGEGLTENMNDYMSNTGMPQQVQQQQVQQQPTIDPMAQEMMGNKLGQYLGQNLNNYQGQLNPNVLPNY